MPQHWDLGLFGSPVPLHFVIYGRRGSISKMRILYLK